MNDWSAELAVESRAAERQPKYARLAERIGAAIRRGDLAPGQRLPSHRSLAYQLGVSIGSVARAYEELAREGLVSGEVGRGTIVLPQSEKSWIGLGREGAFVDLALVRPPPIEATDVLEAVGEKTLRTLGGQWTLLGLGDFAPEQGEPRHRRAAAQWLQRREVPCTEETTCFTVGAQEALASALIALARRSKKVLVERLTFSSLRDLGGELGLDLCPVEMDEQGALPDDLLRQARRHKATVAVLQPSLQSPTARGMSEDRRREIVAATRQAGLSVVEYEAWASVVEPQAPSLAALAPERVIHVEAFSNGLAPGLRVGVLHAPEPLAPSVLAARHALVLATPNVTAEIATHWIAKRIAHGLAAAIAAENRRRMRIARRVLGPAIGPAPDAAPFVWIPCDKGDDLRIADKALAEGVRILPAARFAVGRRAPAGVRVALSSARTEDELKGALDRLEAMLGTREPRDR